VHDELEGHGAAYDASRECVHVVGGYGGGSVFHNSFETLQVSTSGRESGWIMDSRAMKSRRSGHGLCFGPDNCLYAIGGSEDGNIMLASCERLDLRSRAWESISAMATNRGYTAAGFDCDGSLYVVGGSNSIIQPQDSIERYDIRMNCWELLPGTLLCERHSHSLAFTFPGHLHSHFVA